jgi:glutathione S-transferase
MPSYKLYYFDFEGGSGEPTRNAFRLAKIPFEDVRVKGSDWPSLKGDEEKCIYGQMPILEIDGAHYAQSMAILRYVGKVTNLYPSDPVEALRVDELLDAVLDIRAKISPTYAMPDSERIAVRKELASSFIRPRLEKLNCRISDSVKNNGNAVGNKMSIADLVLANDILYLRSGRLDGIDTTVADNLEALDKIVINVRSALEKSK